MEGFREREANFMVVAAIEGYSHRHGLSTKETYWRFRIHNVIHMLRDNYDELKAQSIDQYIDFCEDILRRNGYGE